MRGALPGEEVLLATYTDHWPVARSNTFAPAATAVQPNVTAAQLRARAARYRALADSLHDPRAISEVSACVRELEAEADSLEGRNRCV
jgi:hypothetical protein